jgi:hypothetical protein
MHEMKSRMEIMHALEMQCVIECMEKVAIMTHAYLDAWET